MKARDVTPGLKVVVNDLIRTPLYEIVAVNGNDAELRHVDPIRPHAHARTVDVLMLRHPTDKQLSMHQ